MNKTTLLLLIAGFAIGFVGIFVYNGSLPQLLQSLSNMAQPATNMFQSTLTRIQTIWTTIPESMRGIILLAIPSGFAMFFAWTKTRAMQKLQQTQQEATQQITQISGQAFEDKQAYETKVKLLQEQIANPEHLQQLTIAREEAEQLVTKQATTIGNQKATIDELHRVIEDLKVKVAVKTVVK